MLAYMFGMTLERNPLQVQAGAYQLFTTRRLQALYYSYPRLFTASIPVRHAARAQPAPGTSCYELVSSSLD